MKIAQVKKLCLMALVAFCMADAAYAQPAARRREQQKKT